ncbi:uncharacterized protein CPUR_04376 [Claviceps purpurea 20.1]|uniref:Uncharacterized protein n=1 Tax=Claviceps purpurea (strain 20.1) TaxID=1111077 RepID=M1WAM3_CLAP2|nr:uncharacterized protein CPUR_04376 [Claviceps purpurea 20.1]
MVVSGDSHQNWN